MSLELYYPGLHGVIAGETNISCIEDGLQYRGYDVTDLVAAGTFLETAFLLLFEELPTIEQLADFRSVLAEEAVLPPTVVDLMQALPLHVSSMQALRTGVSLLGHFAPQAPDTIEQNGVQDAIRLMAQVPLLLAIHIQSHHSGNDECTLAEYSYAANVFQLLQGRHPSALEEHALEVALILSAEHEFNASTFVARVIASTQADVYSAVSAAIGAMQGPEHGGWHSGVLDVLRDVGDRVNAEAWVAAAHHEERTVAGFGHPVYREVDPRAALLERYCEEMADVNGETGMELLADSIERAVWEEFRQPPNLSWHLARLLSYLGFDEALHLPIFTIGRLVGWSAHALEQAESQQLIRPRARYRGAEDVPFEPLNDR